MRKMFTQYAIVRCMAASVIAFLLTDTLATAATKVYLLAGQSNMMGEGSFTNELPAPYNAPQPDVKFWNNNQWIALRGGFGISPSQFGPEVGFGYEIHNLCPKDDIYLVVPEIVHANRQRWGEMKRAVE